MGGSSSIQNYHIHMSLSSKFIDQHKIVENIINTLNLQNIKVTKTNASLSVNEICNIMKQADLIIYCNTQSCGTCPTQAIEFSYLMDNIKKKCDLIINPYENSSTYVSYIQGFLDNKGLEISSVEDIPHIINHINKQIMC